MYEIVEKRVLSPEIKLFKIKAPLVAKKAEPGQFIALRIHEKGERIPLTIADFDREEETITVIFMEVGKTTKELGRLEKGDFIANFIGPLGRPSEIEDFGTVVCVGGGVGVAPVYPIARALKEAGNEVIAIIGARCESLLILENEMHAASSELHVATDDGSKGQRGFVTDVLKKVIEERKQGGKNGISKIWAIGPVPMMDAVCKTTRPFGIETIVSLNTIMVDATGMCGACRVTVGEETKFTCVDGPEFDGHAVDFAELKKRLCAYRGEEKESLERYESGHAESGQGGDHGSGDGKGCGCGHGQEHDNEHEHHRGRGHTCKCGGGN
ncbi:MAG: ferredoxin-NADP reductase [Candidatus Anoxymicrobium japonicum]|uniref:Ferredoxin-NADP reductase n=1 Tax=Candidatus Anoxymicrobium japonicum TaxID=2013648 RepID=A0A2N3G4C5_9ACTN|nr:MAG: ferredoxin-NADP reductase [Candidatus Anoxymicrobium japonicum]